jgi:uncharacterized DUF497 family protein
MCMKFEWDPEKSVANKAKHKIDFETAKSLWNDPDRIEILAPYPLENRTVMIARLGAQLWSAVYTMREGSVRIISVRRSRKQEARLYEEEKIRSDQ